MRHMDEKKVRLKGKRKYVKFKNFKICGQGIFPLVQMKWLKDDGDKAIRKSIVWVEN